jgi:hypothetical protein
MHQNHLSPGFSIELNAFAIDGRLVIVPPELDDNRNGK